MSKEIVSNEKPPYAPMIMEACKNNSKKGRRREEMYNKRKKVCLMLLNIIY